MAALLAARVYAADHRSLIGPATPDEVAALVKSLGDPSYEARTFATRRLCAIGPGAADALRAAAEGDDAEVAMRARQLLTVFDRLLFADARISVAFSKSQIAWNEPVDLVITVVNESSHAVQVPFEGDPPRAEPKVGDAQQVGAMLDVADWLTLKGPDGRPVELRMDDLDADESVAAAVQARVDGAPVTAVRPGGAVVLTLRDFNRGWARYPLLDRGGYSVSLEYAPDWSDKVLLEAQAGRIVSNVAKIDIIEAAPATVDRRAGRTEIVLEQSGDAFVARFINRMDQPVLLNANFGATPPFAQAQWVLARDGERRETPVTDQPASSWKQFDPGKVVEVPAGEAFELARIDDARIRKALGDAAARTDWTLGLSYANPCDRAWQARQAGLLGNQDAPAFLREPLPRQLLGTRATSNRLSIAP
jgi:hypothetical protein